MPAAGGVERSVIGVRRDIAEARSVARVADARHRTLYSVASTIPIEAMTDTTEPRCPLCHEDGGEPLFRDDRLRIVLVDDADHPGFLRVIWTAHVKEMTDLATADRAHCMAAVYAAETALREVLRPDKINLASFGATWSRTCTGT